LLFDLLNLDQMADVVDHATDLRTIFFDDNIANATKSK